MFKYFFLIVDICLNFADTARQVCRMVRRSWADDNFCVIFSSFISSQPHAAYFRPAF